MSGTKSRMYSVYTDTSVVDLEHVEVQKKRVGNGKKCTSEGTTSKQEKAAGKTTRKVQTVPVPPVAKPEKIKDRLPDDLFPDVVTKTPLKGLAEAHTDTSPSRWVKTPDGHWMKGTQHGPGTTTVDSADQPNSNLKAEITNTQSRSPGPLSPINYTAPLIKLRSFGDKLPSTSSASSFSRVYALTTSSKENDSNLEDECVIVSNHLEESIITNVIRMFLFVAFFCASWFNKS